MRLLEQRTETGIISKVTRTFLAPLLEFERKRLDFRSALLFKNIIRSVTDSGSDCVFPQHSHICEFMKYSLGFGFGFIKTMHSY